MKSKENHTPLAIRIAADCVALDKVVIIPTHTEPQHTFRPDIRVMRIGNWEKRLAKKSVKHLTEHINFFAERSIRKPIITPYLIGCLELDGIWAYNNMVYDLKAD